MNLYEIREILLVIFFVIISILIGKGLWPIFLYVIVCSENTNYFFMVYFLYFVYAATSTISLWAYGLFKIISKS